MLNISFNGENLPKRDMDCTLWSVFIHVVIVKSVERFIPDAVPLFGGRLM